MAEETIFHKIIRREIPAEVVAEDERAIAFRDINPVAPTHVLVVPKKTLPAIREAGDGDAELLGHLLLMCRDVAQQEGIADDGYRIVINNGENGQQTVDQLHLHVIGGRECRWPPG